MIGPVCVSPMAVIDRSVGEQVRLLGRLPTDRIGLAGAAVVEEGIGTTRAAVVAHVFTVDYLVTPVTTEPSDRDSRRREMCELTEVVYAAVSLGARMAHIASDPSGGLRYEGYEDAVGMLPDDLSSVVAASRDGGIVLAVENTSPVRCDLSFTHSVRDALEVAAICGTRLCLDLYCAWHEPHLAELVARHADQIALVQVADLVIGTQMSPDRWVPDDGDLPLERVLCDVVDAGYHGPIDIELIGPEAARQWAEIALRRSIEWLRHVAERHQAGWMPGGQGAMSHDQ